jgi:Flp pilus assembly protein TadB
MSKERARRRAERLAAAAKAQAEAAQRDRTRTEAHRRRQARRAALRRFVPHLPRRGFSRRTREQRVGIGMTLVCVGVLAWLLFDSWTLRVAVVAVALLATPVFATAVLGRSHR